jgi:hypothetical protein
VHFRRVQFPPGPRCPHLVGAFLERTSGRVIMTNFQGPQGPQDPPAQVWGAPQPDAPAPKPKFRKGAGRLAVGIYAGVGCFILGAALAAGPDTTTTTTAGSDAPAPTKTVEVKVPGPTKTVKVPGPTKTVEVEVSAKTAAKPKPAVKKPAPGAVTASEENALQKAASYLEFTAFSRKGLIEQLEFDKFSTADATYAVDHVEVNWNAQAAAKAKDYLDFTSFSRGGLIEQLEFDGFTSSQAAYGVSKAGL